MQRSLRAAHQHLSKENAILPGLSIRTKLLCACSGLAALTGLVAWIGIWAFSSTSSALQRAANESLPVVGLLSELDAGMQQVLVAERSLMFMSTASTRAKDLRESHAAAVESVKDSWKRYGLLPASAEEQVLWPAYETALGEWEAASAEVLRILSEDTAQARRDAIDLSLGEGNSKFETARKLLKSLGNLRLSRAKEEAHEEEVMAWRTKVLFAGSTLAAFLLAALFSLFLTHSICHPIRATVEAFKDIAEGQGDLTKRLAPHRGEIGELCHWFNCFMDRVHGIVGAIQKNAKLLAESSEDLTKISRQMSSALLDNSNQTTNLAEEADKVNKNVQMVASGAEEMRASIREIARSAEEAAKVASGAVMETEATNVTMTKLTQGSGEIGNVIKVITSIAQQTNLLALNATIEAARAGSAGKGFAVVASEVKSLAEGTGEATNAIAKQIEVIQSDIATAIHAIGRTSSIIKRIHEISGTIAAAVTQQSTVSQGISGTCSEVANGTFVIAKSVANVAQASQATAGCAGDTQEAASNLQSMATELWGLVEMFKI